MTLLLETAIVSIWMIVLSGLPLLSTRVRKHSKLLFLLGTGALSGICLFDLLPDVFEMGGNSSLVITGVVWAVYSLAHLIHMRGHEASDLEHGHAHAMPTGGYGQFFFLASMIFHCVASGILLVVSRNLGGDFGHTVFYALLAHKGYESLTVSSILIEKQRSRAGAFIAIALYALALPAGVVLTTLFESSITQNVALIATSLAVGTLLGCLIFDFLIPSVSHIKKHAGNVGWIALGLLLTQLVMKAV